MLDKITLSTQHYKKKRLIRTSTTMVLTIFLSTAQFYTITPSCKTMSDPQYQKRGLPEQNFTGWMLFLLASWRCQGDKESKTKHSKKYKKITETWCHLTHCVFWSWAALKTSSALYIQTHHTTCRKNLTTIHTIFTIITSLGAAVCIIDVNWSACQFPRNEEKRLEFNVKVSE